MKLSDYVVKFIEEKSGDVFLLSGGGIMHLVDSIGRSKLNMVCCHHEQAAATAAEGYARIKNQPGFFVVTTGPGGTNALTGIAGAWLDSIPTFAICGQVKTDNIAPRGKNGMPEVRAIGFQELNVIDMARPITKYAVVVEDPQSIRYHLERAWFEAICGRPGPVYVEIPLDVQAAEVKVEELKGFNAPDYYNNSEFDAKGIIQKLQSAKKPFLLVGNGVRLGNACSELFEFLNKTHINAATTIFTSDDLITYDYPKYLGRQGMPGNEPANYAIDNCDLLLVIGERLQLSQTSYEYQNFTTQAFKIMVDVDENEMRKKTLKIDMPIHCDAKTFLSKLNAQDIRLNAWDVPVKKIDAELYKPEGNYVNIYKFLEQLSTGHNGYSVVTSDGMASLAPHQALKISPGQRFLTNAGLGNMGSGLPLAIGASVAENKKPIICMEGDGSIMLNIQELQTILYYNYPIKIFIWNNNGYYSIRSTHVNYFKKAVASDPESGLSLPDFSKLIPAWGFAYERIQNDQELEKIQKVIAYKGPIVCELMVDPSQKMLPKWTAGMFRI